MTDFNFMNNPDFGAPGGIRADQAAQMNALSMQGAQAELNMMPDKQAHLRAQTQHLQAQTGAIPSEIELRRATASKAPAEIMNLLSQAGEHLANSQVKEEGLRRMKLLGDALSKASAEGKFATDVDGKPMSVAKTFTTIGMEALRVGAADTAKEFLNQANLAWGHETSQDRLAFDKRKNELDQDLKIAELVGHRTPWITNQKQLDDLNTEITRMTGKPPAWTGVPYSPETVQRLEAFALKAGERANFQLREEKAVFDQRQREFRNDLSKLQVELERDRVQIQRDRLERDRKAGVVSEPSQHNVDSVVQMALQDNPKLKGADNKAALDQFARSIAYDAKKMRAQNPGIDPDVAMYKAYQARKSELETEGNIFGSTIKFNSSKIGTRDTPIPVSPDVKPVEGKYYTNKGQIGQWVKKPDGTFGLKLVE